VAHVGLLEAAILCDGLVDRLVAGLVVEAGVELLSSSCCSNHMQDGVVAVVSKHDHAHVQIVHDGLPVLRGDIRRAIAQAAVNQNNDVLVGDHLANVKETLFKCNLQAHQTLLECKALLGCES